ncbi:hypothetical protein JW949_01780 [Candidatus Woesearchaeota archaeon]|nr:hypothetical protein [Candidatus Woesearchaeota archaeon]
MGFLTRIKQSFKGEHVLYYPGCIAERLLKEQVENYKTLLHNTKINFTLITDLKCCGALLLNNGYKKDFINIMNKNKSIFEKHPVNKIITNCPRCLEMFNNYYDINTEHIAAFIYNNLSRIRRFPSEKVSLISSAILDDFINNNEPRKLLEKAGYIVDDLSSKNIFCDFGSLIYNNPEIADKMAQESLKKIKTKKIIVIDPLTYLHLKKINNTDKEIIELSDAIIQE